MTGYVGSISGPLTRHRSRLPIRESRMWGCNLPCAGNWTACGSVSAPFQKSRLFSRLNNAWLLGRTSLSLDDGAKVTKPPACVGSLLLVEAPKATADDEDHRIIFGRIPGKTARGRLSSFKSSAQHSLIEGQEPQRRRSTHWSNFTRSLPEQGIGRREPFLDTLG